jgi:hypothetical protein
VKFCGVNISYWLSPTRGPHTQDMRRPAALTLPFRKTFIEVATRLTVLAAWTALFRLLAMTLVAALLISPDTRFAQISDAFASIELIVAGVGIAALIILSRALRPISHPRLDDLISTWRFEKRFLPGLVWGATLGALWAGALMLGATADWVGTNLSYEEAAFTLTNTTLRALAIVFLVWCDEYFFRNSIQGRLQKVIPSEWAIFTTALAYTLLKLLQFDLGLSQWLTLLLVSINLGCRSVKDGDFGKGAGLWIGFLLLIHPVLSLPILGNDIQGIFMVKTLTPAQDTTAGLISRWISGGLGGPLSSPALQLLLLLDTTVRWRKLFLPFKSRG